MVKDYTDYIVCGTIMVQIRNMSCSDDHNIDMFDCSTMSTTEGGRKVTAAVASTGRAVASTSRAVGGALSHARGALSGWWSALTTPASAPSTASENSLDDKLDVSDAADPSDAEDAVDNLHDDNRKTPDPGADPPDKLIDEQGARVGKIQVI